MDGDISSRLKNGSKQKKNMICSCTEIQFWPLISFHVALKSESVLQPGTKIFVTFNNFHLRALGGFGYGGTPFCVLETIVCILFY